MGYLGYELKRECGAKANKHASAQPDAAFFLADRVVIVDHTEGDVYFVELIDTEDNTAADLLSTSGATFSRNDSQAGAQSRFSPQAVSSETWDGERKAASSTHLVSTDWIERTAGIVRGIGRAQSGTRSTEVTHSQQSKQHDSHNGLSRKERVRPLASSPDVSAAAQYIEDVRACMEEIRNGETYEVRKLEGPKLTPRDSATACAPSCAS